MLKLPVFSGVIGCLRGRLIVQINIDFYSREIHPRCFKAGFDDITDD